MKIILAALNAKYVHSNLAVYNLEAYVRTQLNSDDEKQPEILIREYTINHNLDSILQSLYREKAEVVAFSCYIWNVQEVLSVARELSKTAPNTRIWLGGPEVSYDSVRCLADNPFVEGIMQGEGEKTFYELVRVWTGYVNRVSGDIKYESAKTEYTCMKKSYANIHGIAYRDDEEQICQNPPAPLMDLDDIPFIYSDLSKFQNRILYYETSRGCPFSCSYCLSSIDKTVRFRSLPLVEKELKFFLDNRVTQVKFVDRTFNCKREHALAIWDYILKYDNGVTNFHFEVGADLLGEEELALFRQMRPGLIQLEIGLQSTNPDTLKEIRRGMDIEKLKQNILKIKSFGNIHQHLDLIAGLPYEDFNTFKVSFQDAYSMQPDQLQLGFLKVLKGSYMEEQAETYGLVYRDTQPYEVLSTKWISYDEILTLKQVEEMVEVYYNSGQFQNVLAYLIPMFETPFQFYEMLGQFYEREQLYGIGFKREARYEALRAFCLEWFGYQVAKGERNKAVQEKCGMTVFFSIEQLDSLLTFDYYLRENAKNRPDWAADNMIEKNVYQTFFRNGGTEEVSLAGMDYDSKAAARAMHIESLSDCTARFLVETGAITEGKLIGESEVRYCLFDYERRNPLSGNAGVTVLNHL